MDAEELKSLYDDHADAVYAYLRRLMRSEEEAFDLMQDAFLRAARYSPGPGKVEKPRSWLLKIAHNLAISHVARRNKQRSVPLSEVPEQAARATDADWPFLREEILARLREVDSVLEQCFLLRAEQGLTHEEIAAIVGTSRRTVRRHFEKIRGVLAQEFADLFPDLLATKNKNRGHQE